MAAFSRLVLFREVTTLSLFVLYAYADTATVKPQVAKMVSWIENYIAYPQAIAQFVDATSLAASPFDTLKTVYIDP